MQSKQAQSKQMMRSMMARCCLYFLVVCAGGGAIAAAAASFNSDVALLLERVKPALQGQGADGNAQLATWTPSTPLCLWRGLRWSTAACDSGAGRANMSLSRDPSLVLLSLRLPASALSGHLPPALAAFSALQSIYLAANRLSGPIPFDLGNAPCLAVLDLASNRLSGQLPPSIWNLCDRLSLLRLHGNALTGPIPNPAAPNTTCHALHLLDFGQNRFSGGFPSFLAAFRGLQRLDLAANRLQGPIPAGIGQLALNLSYNNFSGQLPPDLAAAPADSFLGNSPELCGPPLAQQCLAKPSGLSPSGVAAVVIGLMAGAVVVASVSIGWAQGRWRATSTEEEEEEEGKLVVFEGGEHLTLEEVLNATGQVVDKASYCTVYKAKLGGEGGSIELRLLREGTSCNIGPTAVRRIGRVRHDNLVPLRAFYHGRRGEKLLVYDYFPAHRTLHDLLHHRHHHNHNLHGGVTWARRHKIALGAARALAYVHSAHGEAHGNVRSSNVLVDDCFVARLAEYALHRLLLVPPAVAKAADGYRAPELLLQSNSKGHCCCNPRTDVYAFGILLLELLMGRKPSSGDLPAVVKAAVLEEATMMEVFDAEVARGVQEGLLQALKLAMGCCAPVAAARPTMAEVVRQLEDIRPRSSSRPSAIYSPADTTSDAGTPSVPLV